VMEFKCNTDDQDNLRLDFRTFSRPTTSTDHTVVAFEMKVGEPGSDGYEEAEIHLNRAQLIELIKYSIENLPDEE
jgi:hypothetical protein